MPTTRFTQRPIFRHVCSVAESAGFRVELHTGRRIEEPRREETRHALAMLRAVHPDRAALAEPIQHDNLENAARGLLRKFGQTA